MKNKSDIFKFIYEFIEKMNDSDFNVFLRILNHEILFNESEINKIRKRFALRDFELHSLEFNENDENSWIMKIYNKEFKKVNYIINDNEILKDIKGLKLLLYGQTGTGKTTFVKEIFKANPDIDVLDIKWHNIVSSKMGQTQINLMQLAHEIKNRKNKTIIFLDELDSLITNRMEDSDVGEYSRIVGTFIKFLDDLDEKTIFITSTNIVEKIDPAIKRRFNINIKGKTIEAKTAIEFIEGVLNIKFSVQEKTLMLEELLKKQFVFSEVDKLAMQYKIETKIRKIKSNWAYFLIRMIKKEEIDLEILTKNRLNELEYEAKKYEEL